MMTVYPLLTAAGFGGYFYEDLGVRSFLSRSQTAGLTGELRNEPTIYFDVDEISIEKLEMLSPQTVRLSRGRLSPGCVGALI